MTIHLRTYQNLVPGDLHSAFLVLLLICCFSSNLLGQKPMVNVSLQVDLIENQYLVRGICSSSSSDTLFLSYSMKLDRVAVGREIPTRERTGNFSLTPGSNFFIGPFAVPKEDSSEIKLTLTVLKDGEPIAMDSFPQAKSAQQDDNNQAPPELSVESGRTTDPVLNTKKRGIILGGFVLQQTKTPWGQRFYELFAQSWQQAELETESNIVIIEVPFRGINTIIKVTIDGEDIFSQVLQPKYDYLVDLSNYAFQITIHEVQRRNQIGNDILLESKDDIDIY